MKKGERGRKNSPSLMRRRGKTSMGFGLVNGEAGCRSNANKEILDANTSG
jgi:hypothetical protein